MKARRIVFSEADNHQKDDLAPFIKVYMRKVKYKPN